MPVSYLRLCRQQKVHLFALSDSTCVLCTMCVYACVGVHVCMCACACACVSAMRACVHQCRCVGYTVKYACIEAV